MILTENEKMLLTPSYHVFDMYKIHHDAILLPIEVECENYRMGEDSIPSLSVSASKSQDGKLHVTLCNLNPNQEEHISCELRGFNISGISGGAITADSLNTFNTFEKPNNVVPIPFECLTLYDPNLLTMEIPTKSIVCLDIV